jgi:hypothetical protein
MEVTIKQAKELVMDVLKAGLTPMLHGSPGTSKSALGRQIAKENNLMFIDVRLSSMDPVDLNGLLTLDKESNKASYTPMDLFPLEKDTVPAGYAGWLIMFDEINSASLSIQAACYRIILDRQVGTHNLHKNVAMIAAGNKSTDKAIVNRMSTAMQSRLVHLDIVPNPKGWLEWAEEVNIDYRIRAFIGFSPDSLHVFNPNHNDFTFANSRTWEFVHKIIHTWATIPLSKLPILAGTIGEGVARSFLTYCEIFTKLPTIDQIKANPETTNIPVEASIKYAISALLVHHVTEANINSLMKYINRLPIEFQVITLKSSLRKNPKLIQSEEIKKWITVNAQELL